MGKRQSKEQQPQHRHTSRAFRITLITVIILTILLGLLIAWLLLTQDLSKATSLLSLLASIVAILLGPITLLLTIPRPNGEHHSHTDPAVHSIATQTPLLTTTPLSLPAPQPVSNVPARTSQKSRNIPVTTQVKKDGIMDTRKQFDVFLSYSSKDRTWVNHLKEALQSRGLEVWLDHDEIPPGDLFVGALERGLEESKSVALIVSPESMKSGWVEEEYSRALSLTKRKQQPLRLIPVILRDVELPGFLANRQRVAFPEESRFTQNLEQLIWGITGKRPTNNAAQREDKHFQAGPPLSGDTSLYIERRADHEALVSLRNMDYISFIEPRLQGKTSLIYRLMKQLAPKGYAFVISDLMNERFRKESEEEWYHSLGKWVLKNLDFIADEAQLSLPMNRTTWQPFLESIAEFAREANQKIVIALDMIQVIPPAYATPFFTVIRSVYNERPLTPSLEHLTFITSGAFNPKELILDEGVSNFNVNRRIELEDFTPVQVRQMVDNLQLPDDMAETVAKKVYYWTDGQPYLTQKLCFLLTGIPESVLMESPQLTSAVDRLFRQLFGDSQYLMRIRRLSEREPKLLQYAKNIADGHKPKFNQALNDEHFRLANIYGVIKADSRGRCRIRNRICEQVLKDFNTPTHT